MRFKKIRRFLGAIVLPVGMSLIIASAPVEVEAQNFLNKILGKEKVEEKHDSKKSKDKKKKSASEVNINELSLDDNIAYPPVPEKQKLAIKEYMTGVAKNLAKRKTAKIETMRDGEVVVATLGTDLMFAPNDTVLLPGSKEFLKQYKELLRSPGRYKILLVVHTDDTGSDEYTDRLSELRVDAVYNEIVGKEAPQSAVITYALGATEPLLPNISRANRAANRRLEIFIVPDQKLINLAKSNKLNSK